MQCLPALSSIGARRERLLQSLDGGVFRRIIGVQVGVRR